MSLGSNAFGAIAREHCKEVDGYAACFIEVEDQGKSTFFSTVDDEIYLALDDRLASLNVEIQYIALEEYHKFYAANKPMRFIYKDDSVSAVDFHDVNSCSPDQNAPLNGWWDKWGKCVAGTSGGAILGGLAGTSLGPVGVGIGAVGGALAGAAASCGSTVYIRYKDEFIGLNVNC